jgi:mRNA-degrading endonuclease RelE of RelBE toxin-antitoxin system
MSWFAEIAGKAETFLNKIDRNAADLVEAAADSELFENNRKKNSGLLRSVSSVLIRNRSCKYLIMF